MHEYRLADVDRSARKNNNSLRLDDWVLCRIYNKKGSIEKNRKMNTTCYMDKVGSPEDRKPEILPPLPPHPQPQQLHNDFFYLPSDSVPKMHSDSSCSEHVLSPEFTCEREVQSEPKLTDWEKATLDLPFNYMDATTGATTVDNSLLGSQFQSSYQMSPLQDMFMHLHKPF